jgi:hypothetical protein
LLRSFALRRQGRQTMDDLLDCPTRELGLLTLAPGETRSWRFVAGPRPSLSPTILAYACLDYVTAAAAGERTMSIARLTGDPGSPGRAFRLTETALYEALLTAAAGCRDLRVAEPGGLRQLVLTAPADVLAARFLNDHYTARAGAA